MLQREKKKKGRGWKESLSPWGRNWTCTAGHTNGGLRGEGIRTQQMEEWEDFKWGGGKKEKDTERKGTGNSYGDRSGKRRGFGTGK